MKRWSLFFLRFFLALLLILWGVDKLVNTGHSQAVAERFYFGVLSGLGALKVLGVLQTGLGLAVLVGWARRWTLPITAGIFGVTLIGVWQSVIDPWGWYLEGSNVLFYPSTIIFVSALVLIAFRDEDTLALDAPATESSAPH